MILDLKSSYLPNLSILHCGCEAYDTRDLGSLRSVAQQPHHVLNTKPIMRRRAVRTPQRARTKRFGFSEGHEQTDMFMLL